MTYIAPVLGLLAGVVGIADTIPYVRDTVASSDPSRRGGDQLSTTAPADPVRRWT
jgi:hypothetical protein